MSFLVYRIQFDPELISKGVPFSTPDDIVRTFRDGRPSAFLLQPLTAKIYGYIEAKGNARGFDFESAKGGNQKTELKGLTKEVFFRESGNTGKDRSCTADDVLRFIKRLDSIIVADVVDFPIVDLYKLTGSVVMDWYHYEKYDLLKKPTSDGRAIRKNPTRLISKNGGSMTRKKFLKAIGKIEVVKLEPPYDN